MTRTLFLAMVSNLLMAGAAWAEDKSAKQDSLEGTWKLTSVEFNAQPISMEKLQDSRLVVNGTKYSFKLGDTRLEMTHVLLADRNPKAMDMTIVEGPDTGKTFHAIYKLEGSLLTICRHMEPDKERPAAFGTRPESGLLLIIWMRDKS